MNEIPCDVLRLVWDYAVRNPNDEMLLTHVNVKFASLGKNKIRTLSVRETFKYPEVLMWAIEHAGLRSQSAYRVATKDRQPIVIYWLSRRYKCSADITAYYARQGRLALIKELIELKYSYDIRKIIENAARGGSILVLEWACTKTSARWEGPADLALYNSHVGVAWWLYDYGWPLSNQARKRLRPYIH
jgi:hypothetical protein